MRIKVGNKLYCINDVYFSGVLIHKKGQIYEISSVNTYDSFGMSSYIFYITSEKSIYECSYSYIKDNFLNEKQHIQLKLEIRKNKLEKIKENNGN